MTEREYLDVLTRRIQEHVEKQILWGFGMDSSNASVKKWGYRCEKCGQISDVCWYKTVCCDAEYSVVELAEDEIKQVEELNKQVEDSVMSFDSVKADMERRTSRQEKAECGLKEDVQTAQELVHICLQCQKVCDISGGRNSGCFYPACCVEPYETVPKNQVKDTASPKVQNDSPPTPEMVNHPAHYGGEDNPYETIKVLKAWLSKEQLSGFCLGNAIKYLSRSDKKHGGVRRLEDLRKARWYLDYLIGLISRELAEKEHKDLVDWAEEAQTDNRP